MASAGTLWVSVKPSLEGFGTSLKRQLAQEVPAGVSVAVTADTRDLEAKLAEAKAKLDELRNQKASANVDADTSELERKLAAARAKLDELQSKRTDTKVDADTTAAEAHVRELEARLDAVGAKTAHPRVDVDVAAAEAEVAGLAAELSALDGKRTDVKVDTNDARNNINMLALAGAGLGPALIPVAAGAAAALASIGPAALVGLGAILSLKAAFSGVGDALKAFDTMQTQAGANAGKSATQQQQAASSIASAQDGVTSAERSLTQARAQAADGAVSAAERVSSAQQQVVTAHRDAASSIQSAINSQISAEEALANAQRTEQTAQESLTQARKDAAAQLQSLTFSVQDNTLSQRGAQIQLQDALATQAKNAAPSGSLQGQKDQLSVDQARQRITELQAQGKTLADQKKEADRKGVDGSNLVVNAQNQVTAAVQRTGDAQRALRAANDAVTKARLDGLAKEQQADRALSDALRAQAMQKVTSDNSIASARQGVVSAQRSLDQAQLSAAASASTASSATQAYATAMGKLSPAGRDFVNFYTSQLKPKLDELKAAAQSGLLPGLQDGIRNAFPALDQLKTFVGNVSKAMGDLARDAGKALTSPFWHDFFDFMSKIAAPTIKTLGETFGNFLTGAAGIMKALYEPVFVPIMNWFKDLSEKVKDFGTSAAAGTNSGFNAFLQYVKDNGPQIRDLIGELAKLIGHIVEAMAGQGASTLSVLVDVLRWMNTLPPPVIQGLIDLFIAIKLAKLSANLLGDLAGVVGKLKDIEKMGGLSGVLGKGLKIVGGVITVFVAFEMIKGFVQNPNDPNAAWHANDTNGDGSLSAGERRNTVGSGDLSGIGSGIRKDLQSNPNPLAPSTWNSGTPIGKWLDDNIGNPISDFITRTNTKTKDFLKDLFKFDKIPSMFGDFGSRISGDWNTFWGGISGTAGTHAATVVGKASEMWNGVTGWFGRTKDDVSKSAGDTWSSVTGWWGRTKDDVSGKAGELWSSVSGWFGRTTTDVGKSAGDAWASVTGWWTRTKDDVSGKAGELWAGVTGWFGRTKDDVSKSAGDSWASVTGWWGRTKDDVSGKAGELWSSVTGWFGRTKDDVSNSAGDAWAGVTGWWNRTKDDVSRTAGELWSNVSGWAGRLRDDVIGAFDFLVKRVGEIFDGIRRATAVPVQFVVETVYNNGIKAAWDKVAGFVGLPPLPHADPPQFAAGGALPFAAVGSGFKTRGPRAIVGEGDQRYPEYVIPTDPQHRSRAAALWASAGGDLQMLAGGGILGGIWDNIVGGGQSALDWIGSKASQVTGFLGAALGDPAKALRDLMAGVGDGLNQFLGAGIGQQLVRVPGKMIDGLVGKVQDAVKTMAASFSIVGGGGGTAANEGQLQQWIGAALGFTGTPETWRGPLHTLIMRESGGNPNSINLWDSNAVAGHPSQGLMQTIPGTFAAYRDPRLPNNIVDPIANIVAGINYIKGRYGTIFNVQQAVGATPRGYDEGGMLLPGMTTAVNATGKPERILSAAQTIAFDRLVAQLEQGRTAGGQTNHFQINGVERDPSAIATDVTRQLAFTGRLR